MLVKKGPIAANADMAHQGVDLEWCATFATAGSSSLFTELDVDRASGRGLLASGVVGRSGIGDDFGRKLGLCRASPFASTATVLARCMEWYTAGHVLPDEI